MELPRRRFLSLVPVVPVSGCVTSLRGDKTVALGKITLMNFTEGTVEIDFEVRKEDETVYDRSHRMDPESAYEIVEDWMGQHVNYTLIATVPEYGEFTESTKELPWGESLNCVPINFAVNEDVAAFSAGTQECNEVDSE